MTRKERWRTVLAGAGLTVALAAAPADRAALANGESQPRGEEFSTRFERFVAEACSPCVNETYAMGAVEAPPTKLLTGRYVTPIPQGRRGEVTFEMARAHTLGRPERQHLAMRVSLSVVTGQNQHYRMATGFLDETEVPVMARALVEIAEVAAAQPAPGGPDGAEIDFRGGSVRIGLLRSGSESMAYVQVGPLAGSTRGTIFEVPAALYLPAGSLPALATAVGQVAARIKAVRGQ